jgi:hypothetical protein
LKGQEGVLSWTATLGVAVKTRHLESFKAGGGIVATGSESCNWTRDASNPAGQRALFGFKISTGFGALWTSYGTAVLFDSKPLLLLFDSKPAV